MPSERRRDLILSDLEQILSGPASRAGIATAPYLSSRDRLCRRDIIYLEYERKNESNPNSSFEPVGIGGVSTEYHLLRFENTKDRDDWKKECKRLSGSQDHWVKSDDDFTADRSLWSLERAVADVRNSKKVAINCEKLDVANESECTSEFLDAASHVSEASYCPRGGRGTPNECFIFGMATENGGYDVTIARTVSGGTPGDYSTSIVMEYKQSLLR